jgi:putative hemolysin
MAIVTSTSLQFGTADDRRPTSSEYRVSLAEGNEQRAAVQRLRHQIFSTEYPAELSGPDGFDVDGFDDRCDHLMIWRTRGAQDRQQRRLVATCRLLPPHRRTAVSDLYTATEFDLTSVVPLLADTVEVGRTCVVPEERAGTAISTMWGGIARYVLLIGNRHLIGCASVSLADGGANARAIAAELAAADRSDRALVCPPHRPFPLGTPVEPGRRAVAPPLLRGYLRLGARVGAAPAWDPAFGTADFPVLLDYQQVPQRYLDHFAAVGR